MQYWLDLFTVQTYEEFQKAGSKVSGFREKRWSTCQQIKPGDELLCYITGISRWVGILHVTEPAYRSQDRIWEMDVFPVRLGVAADILLPPEHGIPHRDLLASLHSPARNWSGYLRGSPTRLRAEDGEIIAAAIERAKETPVLRPYDKRKAQRPATPRRRTNDNDEIEGEAKPKLCPFLPTYSQMRAFLRAVEGISASEFDDLQTTVWSMRGTPQERVSWDDPDTWIKDRLSGGHQTLAMHIWRKSDGKVNPRYMRGTMTLADRYDLWEETDSGCWAITSAGQDFLATEFGATERGIDLQEGLAHIMKAMLAKTNARRGELLPSWREHLIEHSNIQRDSVVKDFLYHRLQNLVDRQLALRDGQRYKLTRRGEEYLATLAASLPGGQSRTQELLTALESHNQAQRELLRQRLEKMNPFAFERLICDLLVEMGYEDVEVTQPTNDKGVDVKAVAQFGITTINEVIQVKRHQNNIQRPVLDMLRGSLHRFKAQKGTIITVGDFGKGAKEAAFEMGAAPITLINGETLLDLLMDHEIGMRKKNAEYYELDEEAFLALPAEEVEDEGEELAQEGNEDE